MPKRTSRIRVPYAQAVYGTEEVKAVVDVLKNPLKLSPGAACVAFEKKVAGLFGQKHGVFVNSGSSANLLALESLNLPAGSEIITPVFTFGTTVAPIVQKGLIPVFVDIDEGTYLANIDQIEAAITPKTGAIMIPSLLGNIPDWERLRKIAKKHKIPLVDDSCDTIGATFDGKPTGEYTDISVTSFYASHIITAAATGGMVCVKDDSLARRARIFSAWGRESTLFGSHEKSEDIEKRFNGVLDGDTYDAKFLFTEIGYNFQSTEIAGAFGLVQLKRLKTFSQARKRRFKQLMTFARAYEDWFVLPKQDARVQTNWLAFPLTLTPQAPFTRAEITRYLEEANIQTRPIFTGTILKQPAFSNIKHRKAVRTFPVSDYVMKNGFLIGAHHGLSDEQMDYLQETLQSFLEKYR
ncbi:MAG TPA: aminotransferase class I/II-fold pyridoxal phosphate-dependent enzyme [Candidatus Paceibacterota bacterium]|nr:aminotransferase class I/II-fold pyridoxal phosphate-dependent enzyme [Candidatus Paceibacterota bacterium]